MEVMAVNPVHRLVTPGCGRRHVVGAAGSLVIVAGLAGGYFFNVLSRASRPGAYFDGACRCCELRPVVTLFKAWMFGFIAAMVACYKGMTCTTSPDGVGERRQPGRRAHVHARVRRQLRDLEPVLRRSSRQGSDGRDCRRTDRPGARRRSPAEPARSGPSATGRCSSASAVYSVRDVVLRRKYRKERRCATSATSPSAPAPTRRRRHGLRDLLDGVLRRHQVGLQGFNGLQSIGAESFTGLVGGSPTPARSRRSSPAIALAAQVGAGVHRRARRDAHLRGDRRARGDVLPSSLPGVAPGSWRR